MAKGVDGVGLTAFAVGSVLVYAGIKGYSLLAILENVIVGRPARTDVKIAHRLTIDVPGVAEGAVTGVTATPSGKDKPNGN